MDRIAEAAEQLFHNSVKERRAKHQVKSLLSTLDVPKLKSVDQQLSRQQTSVTRVLSQSKRKRTILEDNETQSPKKLSKRNQGEKILQEVHIDMLEGRSPVYPTAAQLYKEIPQTLKAAYKAGGSFIPILLY